MPPWLLCRNALLILPFAHAIVFSRRARQRKNVLFIVADDMRPDLGAYHNNVAYTPNIDNLANEGLLFNRAYTNFPACAPSRTSFMTGRLPDTTRAFTFANHFREPGVGGENWRSLPQFFKEIGGYYTAMSGKLFHGILPPNNDYPLSWSAKPYSPSCKANDGCPDSIAENLPVYPEQDVACKEGKLRKFFYCAAEVDVNETRLEKQLVDQRTRDSCINQLREGAMYVHSKKAKGFFVACGFHKPHLSYLFPAAFLEHYPRSHRIFLRGYPYVPDNAPQIAWAETARGLPVNKSFNATQNPVNKSLIQRAYLGAVSYIDDNIGRLLSVLSEVGHKEDTLVVLTSDHSVSMGEQGTWGKMTNFESALRVPLIIRAPWIPSSSGRATPVLAELVDLYATITDLVGLPLPQKYGEDINGTSLAPVFWNASKTTAMATKDYAFSQLAKPFEDQPNYRSLRIQRYDIQVMGYTLRSHDYRYTEWFRFDGQKAIAKVNETIGRELYQYRSASHGEVENIVDQPAYRQIADDLHSRLVEKIRVVPFEGEQMEMPTAGEGGSSD